MITKKVNRYYCEFCKKAGCSASHIARHEQRCTNNPNRICGMCGRRGIDGLTAALGKGDDDGVESLRTAANECPTCMLAAIRQSKLQYAPEADEDGYTPGFHVNFDYQAEKEAWWAARNQEDQYNEYY